MDCCMVCLEHYIAEDGYPGIRENTAIWKKYKVQRIIVKHLWWWFHKPVEDQKPNQGLWICQQCWEELWSFHKFYLDVKKKHDYFTNFKFGKVYTKPSAVNNGAKEEDEDHIYLKEELMHLNELNDFNKHDLYQMERVEIEKLKDNVEVRNEAYDDEDNVNYDDDSNEMPEEDEEFIMSESHANNRATTTTSKRGRKPGTKNPPGPKRKMEISSVALVRKYDDYIAANFEMHCGLCQASVADFYRLKTHFSEEHGQEKPFVTCCKLKFNKRGLLVDHLQMHQDPDSFKCKECGKMLPNRRALRNHLERHDITTKPKYQCSDCDKVFYSKNNYEKHKLLHVPDSERRFSCSECHKKFATDALRVRHFNTAHLKIYGKICDLCGKHFTNRDYFRRHMAIHAGKPEPSIPCDICGMKIATMAGLNRHKKRRHTEESNKEVQCPHCPRILGSELKLMNHIYYSHKEWKYSCKYCGKSFRMPKLLNDHVLRHEQGKTLNCEYCPKTFRLQNRLDVHIRRAHTKEWDKARLNNQQQESNSQLGSESEMDLSNDFEVELQEYNEGNNKSGWDEDEEENTNDSSVKQETEKLYACEYCPKSYVLQARLDIHVRRVHTREWEKAKQMKTEKHQDCDVEEVIVTKYDSGNDMDSMDMETMEMAIVYNESDEENYEEGIKQVETDDEEDYGEELMLQNESDEYEYEEKSDLIDPK